MASYEGTVHSSVTEDRLIGLMDDQSTSLANPGICLSCGADHDECEPDAEGYNCYECGKLTVYGAEQIFMCGKYHE